MLWGCSAPKDPTEGWSAKELYEAAHEELYVGNYETAVTYYENLQARYPFGTYAEQALLETAYAYYRYEEAESALHTIDRFLKLHPRHANVPYAIYLKGLVNFRRTFGIVDRLIDKNLADYDQSSLRDSLQTFTELVDRFPDSDYAVDARARIIILRNEMAEHELHVARYYMRRGAYVASINRIQYLLERYQGAPAMADGLALMVDAYRHLGMEDLANDSLAVLALNFPEHPDLVALKAGESIEYEREKGLYESMGLDQLRL